LNTPWRRLTRFVAYVPPGLPAGHRRAFGLTAAGYLLALAIQMGLFLLFLVLGQTLLTVGAATGIAVFGWATLAHRRGRYRAAPHIAAALVVTQAVLSVWIAGTAGGFQLYLLAAILHPWLVPYYPRWLKLAYLIGGAALFAGLFAWGAGHAPVQPMTAPWPAVFAALNSLGIAALLVAIVATYDAIAARAERDAATAYDQSEALLHNILPRAVAARLKRDPNAITEVHADVTILFADIVDFTPLSAHLGPTALVELLNRIFTRFDDLATRHGAEKIKTIGDAYMAVAGLPEPRADHARVVADLALDMLAAMADFRDDQGRPIQLRIGISSGTVVAGVIGKSKFVYDLWGDPVNTAGRMESHGLPGHIQISDETRRLLGPAYRFERRGAVAVKGKGIAETWFLLGRA